MIKSRIPKDIRKYETKIVGPFTLRQMICIAIAVAIDFIILMLCMQFEASIDMIVVILMFADIPIMMFSKKIGGVNMEVYLKEVLADTLISPAKRKENIRLSKKGSEDEKLTKKQLKKKAKLYAKIGRRNKKLKAYK